MPTEEWAAGLIGSARKGAGYVFVRGQADHRRAIPAESPQAFSAKEIGG